MGDYVSQTNDAPIVGLEHRNLRISRGMDAENAQIVLLCWKEIFTGFGSAQQDLLKVHADVSVDALNWQIQARH